MGPKKNKKRSQDVGDQQFVKKQKKLQELLKKVKNNIKQKQHNRNDSEEQDQEAANLKRKEVFDWKLSKQNEKALQQAQLKKQKKLKQKQQKQADAKILSPEQRKQLERKNQKQKQQKQKKQKKKDQKKTERQKQLQQDKFQQQKKKQDEQKQAEQVQKKLNKPNTNGKCIPIFFLIFIISLCVLQYQRQIYTRLSKFKIQDEENFYDVFQIDSGATDKQLKEKYKRLVLKYHPDKNPNCIECQQKFNRIIKAWQVIGSPEKRKHYDQNSGFITQIKSQSKTLTPQNYQSLIQGSKSLWLIQVYDSTQKYCHYFSQFWEEIVQQYGDFIQFGRIDVWTQTDMLSYLPYRFQVFPSIYYYHKGQIGLCDFDFQKPDSSVKRCIQAQYKQNLLNPVQSIDDIPHSKNPSIIFPSKISMGSRLKIINKKYQSQFNYFSAESVSSTTEIIGLLPNGEKKQLQFNGQDKQFYNKYQTFLQSLVLQKTSICELISRCQNQACFVILKNDKQKDNNINNKNQSLNLPQQDINKIRPVFIIQDPQFYIALQNLKNKTDNHQNFDIGLYQNGHIDLGYMDEANILNAEQGENFQQLNCKHQDNSWFGKIQQFYYKFMDIM